MVEAISLKSQQPVAIKHIPVDAQNDEYCLVKILRELQVMSFLRKTGAHHICTGLHDIFSTRDHLNQITNLFIVMELGACNLSEYLNATELTLG